MTIRRVEILDNARKYAALGYAHKMFNQAYKQHTLPIEYLDKMFSFNELFCFHCGKTIELGEKYKANRHSKPNIVRKYYHDSCYQSMFY